MKKQVTFVEHPKRENLFKNGSGHMLMRSAEAAKKYKDGSHQQDRQIYRGARMRVPADGQHMKMIHISKSLVSAPFLQHLALTSGRRRYLSNIANVYSTEHLRRQMKQHYLNVLHACIQADHNPSCRGRYGDHQEREKTLRMEDVDTRTKPSVQMNHCSSSTASSNVILPKIVNR